ncbi:MAG TPA: 2Fe-2S iron-sulfur cluster-binding protein, partial [Actinomycetota bacterium]|nr:2Fe-2S iron-sulfur cluster-binding protein [Actinomycetota bacterium]
LKHHRRRGLYCGTGDCPNCLVTVDGVPGVPACVTPVREGMRVRRRGGWPSVERDALSVMDRLHALTPVGFLYKTFVHPRWAWSLAERAIRRAVGLGRLPTGVVARAGSRHLHADVLVIGGGPSGRAAAAAAARDGRRVVLCDEGEVADPPRDVMVLERHVAVGVYEGPLVPLASEDELVRVHPRRIVVATGATEVHPVFPGNDLPGVMLGRCAVGLARQGAMRRDRVVVAIAHEEGLEHLRAIMDAGVRVVAVIAPSALAERIDADVRTIPDAEVLRAEGSDRVRFAVVRDPDGVTRGIGCDEFVLSLGLASRDDLARMAGAGEPVEVVGDAALISDTGPALGDGYVCLCEDVATGDLQRAWAEGFRSSEILKRYTTATMGPCQGAMCGRHLAAFAAARSAAANAAARTTARPPVRGVPLEVLAAGIHEVIEKRTSLHELHAEAGARLGSSGGWLRPFAYGDPLDGYRAVREGVSVMDVGTLGKFLITGPDATALVDLTFPTRLDDVAPGTARYTIALEEGGYVVDDGLLCSLGEEGWYLTSTSGGADRMEARLRDRADRFGLRAHVIDLTAQRGAIVVAGPRARELLSTICEDPIDAGAFPHLGVRELTVAGVECGAIRTGFVGELTYELHHARSKGPVLWRALARAGEPFDLAPHGLDALEVLRLEKGHLYVGQDTLPDDTPAKLGVSWVIDMEKERFTGKAALERLRELPLERRLVGLASERGDAELRGMPLTERGTIVGRVTSAARSPILDRTIGLGWVRLRPDGGLPTDLRAGRVPANVEPTPFYDPAGERLRA